MKLLFLYGPPAVGKLTIAKILTEKTGYKLLHNHLIVNPIAEIFPFDNPANRLLTREFRLRIIEEAIKNDITMINTFGIAGNDPFSHIIDVVNIVESNGREICLVHLTADEETILQRVEDASRRNHGKHLSKERLQELLTENLDLFNKLPQKEHLTIDTSNSSPEKSAEEIIAYYKL